MKAFFFGLLCLILSCCSPRVGDAYLSQYQYLGNIREYSRLYPQFRGEDEFYLVVLVDARHLDYSSPGNYFATMASGLFFAQDPNTGHAWIVLAGKRNGQPFVFEGGHSGEFGITAPKYFDEVIRLSLDEHDPNPARYLFTTLPDGKLECDSGGHVPTFAAAFPITEEGFNRVLRLIGPDGYDFSRWGLTGPNCIRFVRTCLSAIGVEIECQYTVHIPQSFYYRLEKITLWADPAYSTLIVETPEALEQQLWNRVKNGSAFLAKKWYTQHRF